MARSTVIVVVAVAVGSRRILGVNVTESVWSAAGVKECARGRCVYGMSPARWPSVELGRSQRRAVDDRRGHIQVTTGVAWLIVKLASAVALA